MKKHMFEIGDLAVVDVDYTNEIESAWGIKYGSVVTVIKEPDDFDQMLVLMPTGHVDSVYIDYYKKWDKQ